MIPVDANVLVYAHVSSLAQHERARDWLDQQLNGAARVGLPWASLLALRCRSREAATADVGHASVDHLRLASLGT